MNTLYAADRAEWRAWLATHHDTAREIWLIYYKQATGRPAIDYDAAVEEALCFGWIDSLVKAIDAERYARKFTPRHSGSRWSALNQQRVRKLLAEGRMTPAGLAQIGFALDAAADQAAPAPPATPPANSAALDYVRNGLRPHPRAWENFSRLAPSYQRDYVKWITSARREETRQRRLAEAIALLEQNRKQG